MKARVKPVPVFIVAGMFLLAVILMCFLFIDKPNIDTPSGDLTFQDDAIYNQPLSEEEIDSNKNSYPFLEKFFVLTGNNLLKLDDDSLVMTIFDGEMETENYYLAKIQIEYNKNYIFLSKSRYESFEDKTQVGDYTIIRGYEGTDEIGLYQYLFVSEKDGQRIFWDVRCFEEGIDEFIEIVFSK